MPVSRRASLKLLAASPLLFAPARLSAAKLTDFWNTQEPSQWSNDEIHQLTTDSPWAKPVTAQLNAYSPQNPGAGAGRRGRTGRYSSTSSTASTLPKFNGVVQWLSAKPMLLALKLQLPADFANHYVIGVSDIPVISGHEDGANSADSYDPLKEVSFLEVKGQEPAQAGVIQQEPNNTSTLLFGFLNQFLDLSKAKAATFSTTMGPLAVKAKFELSHMSYKGELAV